MESNLPLHNTCEIAPLRKVLLHRPGRELENLMPDYLERLLFDDIPYLKLAQEEHDKFADTLRQCGVEVLYLTDLTAEAVADEEVRRQFVRDYLSEAEIASGRLQEILTEYFLSLPARAMVEQMEAGVRKAELQQFEKTSLADMTAFGETDYPFLVDPMPNLYFTRDPFAVVGGGVAIHKMHTKTRNRETLFGKYIFEHHPRYKTVPKWYDRA